MELRVFLVEDLANMRELVSELLASLGGVRVVGTASTEAEANLWLDDHAGGWDLAIVDLVLDQGSGFSVISRAAGQADHGAVVVFSSYASKGVREKCLDLGAEATFDKVHSEPFLSWLLAYVREHATE